MPGNADRAAAILRNGGARAKAAGSKLHALATDPEVQAKAKKAAEDGKKIYEVVTSPKAMEFYRQAGDLIKKARKK
ncbi:hypothetical protein QWJ39_14635 [Arthrobacter sp. YD4]|uniref:hypothetical protein n=1 Tax=Arthrobacter sp. YD4 TaxID=3058043 RepID=UPI0025B4A173|nr:hypothetical protein [Arthrobacter sp. YD4]MDN3937542.1 hypothetical protein [Arthrobacter sp. YD4]